MGYVRVDPWTQDPERRLLANSPEGEALGYMDLATGTITIGTIEHATEVATAFTRWYQGHRDAVTQVQQASDEMAESIRKTQRWIDYSPNQPGQETRRRAESTWARIGRYEPRYAKTPEWLHLDKGKPWIKSSKGEEHVARILRRMERKGRWKVLHSIPLPGGGDLDHLLIGPDGVVVINTRHYPKARLTVTSSGIYVNGARTRAHDQVRRQAELASTALTKASRHLIHAIPCIALYNGGIFRPEALWAGSPKGIIVATRWNLRRALCDVDQGLTDEQVEAVFDAARRSTTWVR